MNIPEKYQPWIRVGMIVLVGVFVINYIHRLERKHETDKSNFVKSITYQKTFALDDCGTQERYSRYQDFMIRIWNTYGFTYRKPSERYPVPRAMSDQERVAVWRLNYELSELFGFANMRNGTGYYDIIIKGIIETALDPNAEGGYGERTWLQLKDEAVMMAWVIYKKMLPDRFKEYVAFDYDGNLESVKEPTTALKVAFILNWYYRRKYKGVETWYISMYHWGMGFLGKHFEDGRGTFPTKFTINGIKYDPMLYYITFRTMKDAFESGDIEAGKPVVAKWNRYKQAMIKEELQLLKTHKAIRSLNKKLAKIERRLKEKDSLVEESRELIAKLKKDLDGKEAEFKKIYGNIRNWKQGNLREYMQTEGKKVAKQFLNEIMNNKKDNAITILILIGVGIVGIGSQVFFVIATIKYFRGKRNV